MEENVLLACQKCGKPKNIIISEARTFNKDNPYNCFDCLTVKEQNKEPEQTRLGLLETIPSQDLGTASSPLGNLNVDPVAAPKNDSEMENYSPQSDYYKQKMEDFRQRREQLDRDLQRERERVDNYDHGHGGFNWHMILPFVFIFPIMFLFLGQIVSITSPSSVECSNLSNATAKQMCKQTSSSVDCSTLPGNAGIHQTTENATSFALSCLNQQQVANNITIVFLLILVMICILPIMVIIRML